MRAATIEGACGVAELTVKGESVAVGMRAATIKGACGVAELAVKGESMAVDMRAATTMALRQAMERPWKMSLLTMELLLWKVLRRCRGELAIEDGSLGNGFVDADGAQSHGAEREALMERGHNLVRQKMGETVQMFLQQMSI